MEWNFMSSDACMPWASFLADSTNHSPGVWTHLPVESASFHSDTVQRLPMSLSKVSALGGWRVGGGVARRVFAGREGRVTGVVAACGNVGVSHSLHLFAAVVRVGTPVLRLGGVS